MKVDQATVNAALAALAAFLSVFSGVLEIVKRRKRRDAQPAPVSSPALGARNSTYPKGEVEEIDGLVVVWPQVIDGRDHGTYSGS